MASPGQHIERLQVLTSGAVVSDRGLEVQGLNFKEHWGRQPRQALPMLLHRWYSVDLHLIACWVILFETVALFSTMDACQQT